MQPMYYIGLDVHKRKISYCVKDSSFYFCLSCIPTSTPRSNVYSPASTLVILTSFPKAVQFPPCGPVPNRATVAGILPSRPTRTLVSGNFRP